MRQFPSVSERPTGKLATTQITNELAQAVLAMAPTLSSSQYQQHRSSGVQSVWLIWDKGPKGEDDYTDHRYWIRRAYLSNDGSDDATKQIALTEVPLPDGVSATDQWIQASNMAERPPNAGGDDNTSDASKGTHSLAKGTAIGPIWAQHDDNPPNTTRWMFNENPSRVGLVTVTGNATGGGVYTGYVRRPVKQKFDPTRSGTLNSDSVNQFGEPPSDTSEIYILNAAEEGTDTHALTDAGADVSKTHVGYLLSMPATDGKPVWVINGFTAQTCPVGT